MNEELTRKEDPEEEQEEYGSQEAAPSTPGPEPVADIHGTCEGCANSLPLGALPGRSFNTYIDGQPR
jgi:hypothetical protein